ncbi:helix-turn-helix domain-containing protein [Kitasatospora cineracea]|uniref:helix-turn-helix domain-containing protein n=1 Tax=Kitasatospora cineracea TaxID=88074 RepID=UPI0036DB4FDF
MSTRADETPTTSRKGAAMAWPECEVNPSKNARHFYGAEVRRLRTERGWPLHRLAEAVHFSPSTMSRVENGDVRFPTPFRRSSTASS